MRKRPSLTDPVYEALFTLGVLTVAGVAAIVGITLWLTNGGSGGEAEAAPEPPAVTAPATTEEEPAETEPAETEAETEPAETEPAETEPAETEPAETETEAAGVEGDAAAGAEVFASAGCGSCHTLAAAGSSGNVGPNLDDAQPPAELVVDRVTNGAGVMPAFGETLSEQQILDVTAYVVESTGS